MGGRDAAWGRNFLPCAYNRINALTLLSSGSRTRTTFLSMTRMMSLPLPLPFSVFRSGLTRTATMSDEEDVLGTYCKYSRQRLDVMVKNFGPD